MSKQQDRSVITPASCLNFLLSYTCIIQSKGDDCRDGHVKNKDILPKNRNPAAAGVYKRSLSCQWGHSFHMIKGILLAAGMNRMKKEIIFCRRLYEDSSQNALWRYMLEYFVKRHTEVIREKPGTDVLDPQLAYSIRFYCMGSVGMTREWLMNDNITSAETVVKMMFESMPVNMRRILFENESV